MDEDNRNEASAQSIYKSNHGNIFILRYFREYDTKAMAGLNEFPMLKAYSTRIARYGSMPDFHRIL